MTRTDGILTDEDDRETAEDLTEGQTFAAPWQARVFAAVVTLVSEGYLEWNEFQARLIAMIQSDDDSLDAVSGDPYYRYWLQVAEQLLYETEVVNDDELRSRVSAFESGERDASEFVPGIAVSHTHTHDHDG